MADERGFSARSAHDDSTLSLTERSLHSQGQGLPEGKRVPVNTIPADAPAPRNYTEHALAMEVRWYLQDSKRFASFGKCIGCVRKRDVLERSIVFRQPCRAAW